MHIINQYEDEDHVIIDICCYKDPEMINCMYLESIANMQSNPNYASLFRGRPLRFVLPLKSANSCNTKSLAKSFSLSNLSARLQRNKMKHSESHYESITQLTTNCHLRQDCTFTSLPPEISRNYETLGNLVTLANTKAEAFQMKNGGGIMVKPELLCDLGCETPRINYDKYLGKLYEYCKSLIKMKQLSC